MRHNLLLLKNASNMRHNLLLLKNGPILSSFSFIFGLFEQTSLQFVQ